MIALFGLFLPLSVEGSERILEVSREQTNDAVQRFLDETDAFSQFQFQINGIDENGVIDANEVVGQVKIEDYMDINPSEINRHLWDVCSTIENLFANEIDCTCQNAAINTVLTGLTDYKCTALSRRSNDLIAYTPFFEGLLTVRLFAMEYKFMGKVCANDISTFLDEFAGEIPLGDFCVSANVEASIDDGAFSIGVTGCEIQVDALDTVCSTCTPCEQANGEPGISFTCSRIALPAGCLPFSLPFDLNSAVGSINDEELMNNIDLSGIVEAAVAQFRTETPEPEPEELSIRCQIMMALGREDEDC